MTKIEHNLTVRQIGLISIIVPVYNGEQLLSRCIESILNQTYTNFELIVVNDGSTDGTADLCNQLSKKDDRIKVIHKEQGGAADARNTGLDHSIGEYITFVDSDDIVCDTYLETLLIGLKKNAADISICKYQGFSDENIIREMKISSPANVLWNVVEGRTICKYICDYKLAPQYVGPVGKLYKRSCFTNIRFPKGKMNEDQFTTYKVIYGKNIADTEEKLYFYYANPSSVSNSGFSLKRYDNLYALEEAELFYKEVNDEELAALAHKLRMLIAAMFVFSAKEKGIYNQVPPQFKINERKAAHLIYEGLGNNEYEWFVSKTHPLYIQVRARIRKILHKK